MELRSVTLVMQETRCHELARLALEDTIKHVEFGEVLIVTDKPEAIKIPGATYVTVEDWPRKIDWCRYNWFELPQYINTDQTLLIQWDSWIYDPTVWQDEWLKYDYVGAPWWYSDSYNVGNSGFCLKSRHLMDWVAARKYKYPVTTSAEDALLSRRYRPQLEQEGNFLWAPNEVALDFAFEVVRRSKNHRTFGFHALPNWRFVLDGEALAHRIRLAEENPYIKGTVMLQQFRDGCRPYYLDENG